MLLRASAWSLLLPFAACLPGCGSEKAPSEAPTGAQVAAGDTSVTVTWDMQPGLQYWVFRGAAAGVTPQNWTQQPLAQAVFPAVSPLVIGGLLNGTLYSFSITATRGGPEGPGTPSIAATPRPAGGTWTAGAPLANARLAGVAYGLAHYVAVGLGGAIFTSTDGVTWTAAASNLTADLNAVAAGSARQVVAGAQGAAAYSTDTVTWTAATIGDGTTTINGLAAFGTAFVAVGTGGAIYTSVDGATWTAQVSGTTRNLVGVDYLNGTYVALGESGTLLTSADLVTWTQRPLSTTATLRAAAYLGGNYVAVGDAGTLVSSIDAVTWTAQPALGTQNLNAIGGISQWITVGDGGAIYTSTDAVTWTPAMSGTNSALRGLSALLGPLYRAVVVGDAGTNLVAF
jgi:hypothetical protein